MDHKETQVEHIWMGNHTGGKLDRKTRMTPDFKIKRDVMRTRTRTRLWTLDGPDSPDTNRIKSNQINWTHDAGFRSLSTPPKD